MPDIETIQIYQTKLIGELFMPLSKSINCFSLEIISCDAEMVTYESLIKQNNTKRLTIISPSKSSCNLSREDIHQIVTILCQAKHLENLTLDKQFYEWKSHLNQSLINTEITFCCVGVQSVSPDLKSTVLVHPVSSDLKAPESELDSGENSQEIECKKAGADWHSTQKMREFVWKLPLARTASILTFDNQNRKNQIRSSLTMGSKRFRSASSTLLCSMNPRYSRARTGKFERKSSSRLRKPRSDWRARQPPPQTIKWNWRITPNSSGRWNAQRCFQCSFFMTAAIRRSGKSKDMQKKTFGNGYVLGPWWFASRATWASKTASLFCRRWTSKISSWTLVKKRKTA